MPNQKTTDLFDEMIAPKTLDAAWAKVRGNNGCAGGDGETLQSFGRNSARRLLLLANLIRRGDYRPRDLRLLHIPKKSGGTRPLAIPSVEDRVAQTACAQVLTPVLDPLFEPSSFAYRPGRSVDMAVRAVGRWRDKGFTHVVEADILRCFERIPQDSVLDRLETAIACHRGASRLADLVALWLEQAAVTLGTPGRGLPQGSPLSPLLANLHLDRLDETLEGRGVRLIRFADDFVLLCKGRAVAEAALDQAGVALTALGLELRSNKTRIVDFDRGFEFLGHLFVRSMTLRRVADPEEDAISLLARVAEEDATEAVLAKATEDMLAEEEHRGFDRGARVLHVVERGRRLSLTNLSFQVEDGDSKRLLAVSPGRVDRIELGPQVEADFDALKVALAHGTEVALITGLGDTLGRLVPGPAADRAALHLAQAEMALTPDRAAALARILVAARVHNQRAQLHRLNRAHKDAKVIAATRTLGRMIRKLPAAGDVASLRGHEGAAGAVYWPALGRLTVGAPQPFRRTRPAEDPLNAAISYLTALLARDVRAALVARGLHPGFVVLHAVRDGHEAAVWDLMEPWRAAFSEGLAATLFNQTRLRVEMFGTGENSARISGEGRRALVIGYEAAMGRVVKSHHSGRQRRWRVILQEEATALGRHCLDPKLAFAPLRLDH